MPRLATTWWIRCLLLAAVLCALPAHAAKPGKATAAPGPEPWRAFGDDYREWLGKSRIPALALRESHRLALERGFHLLDVDAPTDSWPPLRPGDGVVVAIRDRTTLVARIGSAPLRDGLRIVAAHIDAPSLRVAPRIPESPGALGEAVLLAHSYGGLKDYQWYGLPLMLLGWVAPRAGDPVLVSIGPDDGFSLLLSPRGPDAPPPVDARAAPPEDESEPTLFPLVAATAAVDDKTGARARLLRILDDRWGLSPADLEAAELYAVPAAGPRDSGLDRSLILGPGQDDRICSYAALRAVLDLEETPIRTVVAALVDREEIGSTAPSGMRSELFELAIHALLAARGEPTDAATVRETFANTEVLSADVKAAVNPLFSSVHDRKNAPTMGRGPTIVKFTGSRGKLRASDALPGIGSWLRTLARDGGIPTQDSESGKVDEGGGGTVAKFLAMRGMNVLDIGIPLLSMHAPYELSSKADVYNASRLMRAFYEAPPRAAGGAAPPRPGKGAK